MGITTRHNTFFQMAGNFSFGDYFKRGAIELAWNLLTKPVADGGYGFDPERLWATVFYDDDEAEQLWQEVAGLPPEHGFWWLPINVGGTGIGYRILKALRAKHPTETTL